MKTEIQLCKYLISVNKDLIDKTALSNCHCIGLNSFIINEKPRIRLYIAEPDCELFEGFGYLDPKIPIHPHKYDDIFYQLEGQLIHVLYKKGTEHEFKKYRYSRLDSKTKIECIGVESLDFVGTDRDVERLKSKELHTVALQEDEDGRCSWLIIETFEDKDFQQIAYHQNLVERPELYVPMEDATTYLDEYFKNVFD